MRRALRSSEEPTQVELFELLIRDTPYQGRSKTVMVQAGLWTRPWIGWAFVYTFALLVFFMYRCASLQALILMYGNPQDLKATVKTKILCLGALEDFVATTYFACCLWVFDNLKHVVNPSGGNTSDQKHVKFDNEQSFVATGIFTFATSWLLFVGMMLPFVADLLLVRTREMRFTFELIATAISNEEYLSAAPISRHEINVGLQNVAVLVIIASFFGMIRVSSTWSDLTLWSPALAVASCITLWNSTEEMETNTQPSTIHTIDMPSSHAQSESSILPTSLEDPICGTHLPYPGRTRPMQRFERSALVAAACIGLVLLPIAVVGISCFSSPLVSFSAVNATLNEVLAHALQPALTYAAYVQDGQAWVERFIHPTENYTLFGGDSLFRRTTGFNGNTAFDVKVSPENPPNVVLVVVESFRYQDSHYLVGQQDPSNLFNGSNITITPNFDRWAKRGVALRNMWSSGVTSRSVESLQFGQIPYDSVTDSGMTGGKIDTKLSGLPQLFSAKGNETFFTTGCLTNYDDWDTFIPSHGFDTLWDRSEMMKLAESDLGIEHEDWDGDEKRRMSWGVHDDLTFQLLGDLLVNKTEQQRKRMTQGKPKKPLFLTHYTISSHEPFNQRPTWYAKSKKPDFSTLYEGSERASYIRNYLEMRYFSDMELGKFMDRMSAEGVLNDTIVVIVGDHGRGVEVPKSSMRELSVTRVAAAIVAEGRLGNAAGLVIHDATEHYDILNTLADITGVPKGGFLQDGVGRSLKRSVKVGDRVVFSNDPSRKMSIVRGHLRLRYDRITDGVLLHNADTDHDMTTDLFPTLTDAERADWELWRDNGRRIDEYYVKRWDGKCLLDVACSS